MVAAGLRAFSEVGYVLHSPGHGLAELRGVGALARAEALQPLPTVERGVHHGPGGLPY